MTVATFTKLYIANLALSKIGSTRITNFDTDTTKAANEIRACYDSIIMAELRVNAWKFAITRAEITADPTPPSFGRNNRYELPANFIRDVPLDPSYPAYPSDWLWEGNYILTDDPGPIWLRFVRNDADPSLYDPMFVQGVACRLGFEVIPALKQNTDGRADMARAYTTFINDARRINAIEIGPAQGQMDEWQIARISGPSGLGADRLG